MTPPRTRRSPRRTVATVVAVLLIAGCAGSEPPAESVPALRSTLTQVDRAIAAERYGQARAHLDDLVRTTTAARDDGELESAEAERILAAAASLMSALPRPEPPEPRPESTAPPESDPGGGRDESDKDEDDDGDDDGDDKAEKKREEAEKRKEKADKREDDKGDEHEDEGRGNGDSEDNGPDDGEGN